MVGEKSNGLIAHAIVMDEEDRLLIIRRTMIKRGKNNFLGGKWDIPGGTVEPQEMPRDAAIRETMEEVGLEVQLREIVYETSNYDQRKNMVFTTLFYTCNLVGKKKVTLDREEHDKYQWVTLEELCAIEETELVPYMKSLANIMKKYLKIQQYFDVTLE